MTHGKDKRIKNVTSQHKVTKRKLKWVPIEIFKVTLNPEQAVLTCCAFRGLGQTNGTVVCAKFQCFQTGNDYGHGSS